MTELKAKLIDSFIPKAVLVPITIEAKNSVIETFNNQKVVPITDFPFKVGRESRMGENERGLFVKLRILSSTSRPNNDLYLVNSTSHLEISKEHFEIIEENATFFIKDRNSSNGTKINDIEISSNKYPLKDGDVIKIGSDSSMFIYQFLIMK